MGSSCATPLLRLLILSVLPLGLAAADGNGQWLEVAFPHDSPVLPINFSLQEPGPTTVAVRGASLAMDVHASLLLRNTGNKPISGLTLLVETPDLMPGGKGSVTIPSLHAQPGEVFPVRIDIQLLRPLSMGRTKGPMMQLSLDCALFSDLSAYGPDKLHSRRMLTVYELEARRDRQYLAALLDSGRLAELREELNFGLEDFSSPQLSLELLHKPNNDGRPEQRLPVDAVSFPSSPVKPLGGNAQVFANELRASQLEVRNISGKAVKNFEVGWIVRDDRGRDFVAGSVPAAIQLGPIETARMQQPGTLRFSHPSGQPMVVDAVLAFVDNVEFADGQVWIPSRLDIDKATSDTILRRALAASPEQQRLADIYRRKGMSGLQRELKKSD